MGKAKKAPKNPKRRQRNGISAKPAAKPKRKPKPKTGPDTETAGE